MKNWITETELAGTTVDLIPLKNEHKDALLKAAEDGELWKLWYTSVPSSSTIDGYLGRAVNDRKSGLAYPFAVWHKEHKKIIGSTRYCNIDSISKRLEIGYTWYGLSYQKTGVNTECKYLLLGHAFEHLNAIAVEFRTHWHNLPSRRAIARLGAKQDGILRNHKIDNLGNIRDTVVFSIIDSEWATVKKSLEFMMQRKS